MSQSQHPLLEICTPTIQSVLNAEAGGADRIELCTGLELGGLTPSPALIRMALSKVNIPIIVLIRPRPGDFCYSADEFEAMKLDVQFCRMIGVAGVACGMLTRDGHFDLVRMKELKDEAGEMHFTVHRAFDFVHHPVLAVQQLIDLGCDTILSSGQQQSALEGAGLLQKLNQEFGTQIEIMAGGGVRHDNVTQLIKRTRIRAIHASASRDVQNSELSAGKTDISLTYRESSQEAVQSLRRSIDAITF